MAERTHPHAEATYRVIPFDDGTFGVEVSIPDSYPTTVSKFASEVDAEAWIAEHQRRVQTEIQSGHRLPQFRRS
jgi:hypothetical protein